MCVCVSCVCLLCVCVASKCGKAAGAARAITHTHTYTHSHTQSLPGRMPVFERASKELDHPSTPLSYYLQNLLPHRPAESKQDKCQHIWPKEFGSPKACGVGLWRDRGVIEYVFFKNGGVFWRLVPGVWRWGPGVCSEVFRFILGSERDIHMNVLVTECCCHPHVPPFIFTQILSLLKTSFSH